MKLIYHKNLDGIRAFAALMVMAFHFFLPIQSTDGLLRIVTKLSIFGQTGVTLFFVLSGFLITRILFATKDSEDYFKTFYLRRTVRIFPLYYFYLLIVYYLLPLGMETSITPLSEQVYYYTYLQNFASTFNWGGNGPDHFWSLAVEEHFYLFWPLVVYLVSKKNLTKVIIGIVLFSIGLRAVMVYANYEVFYFTFTRFDSLAIGALIAILEQNKYLIKSNSKVFIRLMAGIFVPTVFIWTYFSGKANETIQIFKFTLLAFTYFSAISWAICLDADHWVNRMLTAKILVYTGKISYGLYVYHPLVYSLSRKYLMTDYVILNLLLQISISYMLSALSYHLFESKFLKLKRFFEYNSSKEVKSGNISAKVA